MVGETILDFLTTVEGGQSYLVTCRAARSRQAAISFKVSYDDCRALIAAVDTGARFRARLDGRFDQGLDNTEEVATFDKGKLVEMALVFRTDADRTNKLTHNLANFPALVRNLIERFGNPTAPDLFGMELSPKSDNQSQFAEWNLPELHILLKEAEPFPASRQRRIELVISTAEEYDRVTGNAVKHADLLR
jgi:hypothetical protein